MKKLVIYIISFVLIFNPTVIYAKNNSIEDKTKFYEVIDCINYVEDFNEFSECVEEQSMASQNLGKLNKEKKKEFFDILAIVNIINENVEEGFVEDSEAFNNWNDFLNSNYKTKSEKMELKKIVDNTKCKNNKDYEEFISCFNSEFRTYDIYQYASIKTKERMEHIVFNSFILTKPRGLVYTLKKENIWGQSELDKLYKKGDGFDFFFTLMNALGTEYFGKPKYKVHTEKNWKKSETNWGKVIKFIVIAAIVGMLAKGAIKTFSKSSFSSSGSSASSSSGLTSQQAASSARVASQPLGFRRMFRYAPSNSAAHTRWFKYGFVKGFW